MLLNQLKSIFFFSVRVRYAPSPTGPMHLGAVRTALFNYMFAKHNNGKFILRIEDTDLERNVKGSAQQILDTLSWLKIQPDQSVRAGGPYAPYVQSQRLNIYKQIQNQLLLKNYAYPCFCENTSTDKKSNKKAHDHDQQKGYNGTCRKLSLDQIKQKIKSGQKYVIRIKSDIEEKKVKQFKDQIYGNISAVPFDDFVLVKKNGYPTYHFANVVDDWKMGITHVIRGVEWLMNTPKHIYLYNLLGATPPTFMHLPLIFTADGKKLSKRDPTAPIAHLKQKGYLPQSIINYTGLMGFTPKTAENNQTQEKPKTNMKEQKNQYYSLKQLCELFQLTKVNNSPIKSDIKKLNFFNRYYMRKKWKQGDKQFQEYLISTLRNIFNVKPQSQKYQQQFLKQVVECTLERVSNIDDFKQYGYFFSKVDLNEEHAIKDIKKLFGPNSIIQEKEGRKYLINYDQNLMTKNKKILHNLRLIFVHIIQPSEYSEQKIAEIISKFLYDNKQLQNQDVYHILRFAVTGRKSGVNIVKTCYVLGRDRIEKDLQNLSNLCQQTNKN